MKPLPARRPSAAFRLLALVAALLLAAGALATEDPLAALGLTGEIPADWRLVERTPEALTFSIPGGGRALVRSWQGSLDLGHAASALVLEGRRSGWTDIDYGMILLHGRRAFRMRSGLPGGTSGPFRQVAYLVSDDDRSWLLHVIRPGARPLGRGIGLTAESLRPAPRPASSD